MLGVRAALAAVTVCSVQPALAQDLPGHAALEHAALHSNQDAAVSTVTARNAQLLNQIAASPPVLEAPAIYVQPVAVVAETCPQREGVSKYICYGPCCAIPWGPGGPICLALSAISFRYAMPFTFSGWFRRDIEQADKERGDDVRVDRAGLAFSVALFASAAPRTAAGAAYSFALLVLSLA